MHFMSDIAPITLHTDASDYFVGGYCYEMYIYYSSNAMTWPKRRGKRQNKANLSLISTRLTRMANLSLLRKAT